MLLSHSGFCLLLYKFLSVVTHLLILVAFLMARLFFYFNGFSWSTCSSGDNNVKSFFIKVKSISFFIRLSFRARDCYLVLAFCVCCLTIFICLGLLMRRK